jgi:uncharacterized protein (DUF433 family)
VESVPGKLSGARALKGTRMPVSAIFENLEAGANIDDIMQWYDGLNREQLKAVIEFAVCSLDRLPEYADRCRFFSIRQPPYRSAVLTTPQSPENAAWP